MLSENQIKRLLEHCEKIEHSEKDNKNYNKGWCQALRLILEEDTYPIRKDPIDV
jgi:hypothetical protein